MLLLTLLYLPDSSHSCLVFKHLPQPLKSAGWIVLQILQVHGTSGSSHSCRVFKHFPHPAKSAGCKHRQCLHFHFDASIFPKDVSGLLFCFTALCPQAFFFGGSRTIAGGGLHGGHRIDVEAIHSSRHNQSGAIEAFIVLSRSAQVPARLRGLACALGEFMRDTFLSSWRVRCKSECRIPRYGVLLVNLENKPAAIETSAIIHNMRELRVRVLVFYSRK